MIGLPSTDLNLPILVVVVVVLVVVDVYELQLQFGTKIYTVYSRCIGNQCKID